MLKKLLWSLLLIFLVLLNLLALGLLVAGGQGGLPTISSVEQDDSAPLHHRWEFRYESQRRERRSGDEGLARTLRDIRELLAEARVFSQQATDQRPDCMKYCWLKSSEALSLLDRVPTAAPEAAALFNMREEVIKSMTRAWDRWCGALETAVLTERKDHAQRAYTALKQLVIEIPHPSLPEAQNPEAIFVKETEHRLRKAELW